jgi:hypothetical protein
MVDPSAGDVLRAAVVARKPVFMRFRRGGSRWLALAKMPPHHPPTLDPSRQQSLRSAAARSPRENQRSKKDFSNPQREILKTMSRGSENQGGGLAEKVASKWQPQKISNPENLMQNAV